MAAPTTRDRVVIFDTTLRDGEQSPGASLTSMEKLEIARQLARLGVDVIEAGFPAASPDDLEAVRRIATEVGTADGPTIAGLARAHRRDIDAAWEAVQPAAKPRIHTFIATSDLHLEHKLRMSRQQVLDKAREMVAYARAYCEDVEFSPEDAGRSDPEFLASDPPPPPPPQAAGTAARTASVLITIVILAYRMLPLAFSVPWTVRRAECG